MRQIEIRLPYCKRREAGRGPGNEARSAEHWVKLFDATRNVSPRHRSSHILNEFEELTVLQTLLTSPSTYLHEVQS